jgi:hypothetical protein
VEQKRWGLPPLACRFAKALPHCSQVGDSNKVVASTDAVE